MILFKRFLVSLYLICGGLLIWRWIFRKRSLIVLFHEISQEDFKLYLRFFSKYFRLAPLKELDAYYLGEGDYPAQALFITIDDGWKSNYELLPVVIEEDVPITIFVLSGLLGTNRRIWNYPLREFYHHLNDDFKKLPQNERLNQLYELVGYYPQREYEFRDMLSISEFNEMKSWIDFQSHGSFHPVLSTCSDLEVQEDIACAKNDIEKLSGEEVYAIAYPYGYGKMGDREAKLASENGYRLGRVANMPKFATPGDSSMKLPTLNLPARFNESETKRLIAWAQIRTILGR